MNYSKMLPGLLFVILFHFSAIATPKYIIGLSVNYIDFKAKYLPDGRVYNITPTKDTIWPGDTIGIQAGARSVYLRIRNLVGSVEAPVTLINHGGRVVISNLGNGGAMSIKNSRYIRLSGSGDPQFEYGILIDSTKLTNSSLALDELTSDVEIHHLEICRSGFAGIVAKTDPGCDPATHRENFVMQNLHFHHNYIHHTYGEGLYIGFSNYGPIVKSCSGVLDTIFAHEVKNLRVNDNIIDHTGLDGIQVGCATENILVYNNTITRTGASDNTYSKSYGMEGIVVGGGSTGRYFNNYIADSYGSGIFVFGTGDVHVFNNTIVRPGLASHFALNEHYAFGIMVADRTTVPGASFYLMNNTIVSPRTSGIKITSTQSRKNRVYNNFVVDPLSKHHFGTYGNNWLSSCLQIGAGCSVLQQSNHFDTVYYDSYHGIEGSVDPYFEDGTNGNFRLRALAPIIDKGMRLDSVAVFDFDADSLSRSSGNSWDLGAFENHDVSQTLIFPGSVDGLNTTVAEVADQTGKMTETAWRVFARNGQVIICQPGIEGLSVGWMLFQVSGQRAGFGSVVSNGAELMLPTGSLNDGVYLLALESGGVVYNQKILLVN